MKPAIFSAALLALFAAATTGAQARTLDVPPTDTIVVRLPNKAIMTLVVEVLLEKKFGMVVNIDGKDNAQPRTAISKAAREARRDSLYEANQRRHRAKMHVVVDLGLNALTNRGSGAPDLRTLGSRYISLNLDASVRLGGT
nr:hypothetical protein [Tanacetum cinerariifolium]